MSEWFKYPIDFQKKLYEFDGNISLLSRKTGVSRNVLRGWKEKHDQTNLGDNTATVTSDKGGETPSIEELMKKFSLSPDEWEPEEPKINKWDSYAGDDKVIPLYQLKVRLLRKKPIIPLIPARADGWKPKKSGKKVSKQVSFGVIVSDQQIPYHDPHLHELFLAWLEHNKPDWGKILGDYLNVSSQAKYVPNPEWNDSLQENLQAGYEVGRDYVNASPETTWKALLGNHEERLYTQVLTKIPELYKLHRADNGQELERILSYEYLMRFDELGIELIEPDGKYTHAQDIISPELAARHGHLAGKNAASKSIERLDHSLVFGHTHAKSVTAKTLYDIDRVNRTIHSIENPAMCLIQGGLGYAVDPNWSNGFTTFHVWDDGKFSFEQAIYDDGELFWRDQRYSL